MMVQLINQKKLLKSLEKKDKDSFSKNKGLNLTNNVALKLSKGKYITRLDADDWLDENFLQVMVNQIKKILNLE